MAYSVKFKRKKRKLPRKPITVKAVVLVAIAVIAVGFAIWGGVTTYFYVHYSMPYVHSSTVWGRQIGSAGNDDGASVATDRRGNVFVAGTTDGSLYAPSSTHTDGFIAEYDASGRFRWGRQIGTDGDQTVAGVAPDSQGGVFVAGGTEGSLYASNPVSPTSDQPDHQAFIARFDKTGRRLWGVQFGVGGDDAATAVAVDLRDNVYVCGDTDGNLFDSNADPLSSTPGTPRSSDVWIVKYSPTGSRIWALQIGAPGDDDAEAIAVDPAGEAFLAGGTHELFRPYSDDRDAFIAKISITGTLAWGEQVPQRQNSFPAGVACDAGGNSYLAADMIFGEGILHSSAAVAEFSPSGVIQQRVEMPSRITLDILSATPDASGGLTIAGSTNGHAKSTRISGHAGVARYDRMGKQIWATQIPGRASSLFASAVSDDAGYVYATGKTEGSLYDRGYGSDDAIVVKLAPTGKTEAPSFAGMSPIRSTAAKPKPSAIPPTSAPAKVTRTIASAKAKVNTQASNK